MECNSILSSIHAMPLVEGPIPITAESYPFCDMMHSRVPLDVTKYDYIEEEYSFQEKPIYDAEDGELKAFNSDINYKTRVIVRKPKSKEKFSRRVYFDILNATQNYDIEDLLAQDISMVYGKWPWVYRNNFKTNKCSESKEF